MQSTEILKEFGKALLNEMTQMFEEESNVVIPFTEDSLREICSIYGFDYNDVLRAFKAGFISCGVNDYYVSLACCTFQVMVAYDCLASDTKSYNNKLVHLIQSVRKDFGEPELQNVYSEEYYTPKHGRKQELLWEGARNLLEKKKLHLCIPERTTYSGRYVQYPLKQRVIDRKTLQKYINVFKKRYGSAFNSSYSFKSFSKEVFRDSYIVRAEENKTLLRLREADGIARRIVFYCFCNWVEHEVQRRGPNARKKKNAFIVKIVDETFVLFMDRKRVQQFSASIPFRPFLYDETYDEWNLSYSSITLSGENTVGVLLNRSEWKDNSLLTGVSYYEGDSSSDKRFYINPVKYIEARKEWLKKEKIKFVGGIRDNDGRWILTLLPTIINIKKQHSIGIDHKVYPLKNGTFDLNSIKDLGEGIHVIRLFGRSPLHFETILPDRNNNLQRGWAWKKKEAQFIGAEDRDIVISGLFTNVPYVPEQESKHWGNAKIEGINDKYNRIGALSKMRSRG